MKDRVPTHPGRVKLTPVIGEEDTYDLTRADEPEQEGTPLNSATLLTDQTAKLYGLEENNAVPEKVFEKVGKVLPKLATKTEIFTQDGVFRVPDGVTSLRVMCYGAGGAGGYGRDDTDLIKGGGGGGGYYAEETIEVTPGEVIPVTIGQGGGWHTNSKDGGATSFGTYLSADGGERGANSDADTTHSGGGYGSGGSGGSGGGAGSTNYTNSRNHGGTGAQFGGGGASYSASGGSSTRGVGGSMGGDGGARGAAGENGIDTTEMDVPFPGTAEGGTVSSFSYCGGGGGGYGAKGGSTLGNSNTTVKSGGGGGGYGGAGGSVEYSAGGGGGGGYGPNGKGGNGADTLRSTYYISYNIKSPQDGGIGAGGGGGNKGSKVDSRGHIIPGKGGDGICIVTYTLPV